MPTSDNGAYVSISGVVLGGSLIMFACFLVNECDVRAVAAASSGVGSGRLRFKYGQPASQPVATSYSYGWSFVLAVLAFLASEASAVLCFTAFIRRFDSEVRTNEREDLVRNTVEPACMVHGCKVNLLIWSFFSWTQWAYC